VPASVALTAIFRRIPTFIFLCQVRGTLASESILKRCKEKMAMAIVALSY